MMDEKTEDLLQRIEAGEQVEFSASFTKKLLTLGVAVLIGAAGLVLVYFGSRFGWGIVGLAALLAVLNFIILFMPSPKLILSSERMVIKKTTLAGKDDKDFRWNQIDMFFISTGEMNDRWVSFRTEKGDHELGDEFGCKVDQLADMLNAMRVKFTKPS